MNSNIPPRRAVSNRPTLLNGWMHGVQWKERGSVGLGATLKHGSVFSQATRISVVRGKRRLGEGRNGKFSVPFERDDVRIGPNKLHSGPCWTFVRCFHDRCKQQNTVCLVPPIHQQRNHNYGCLPSVLFTIITTTESCNG